MKPRPVVFAPEARDDLRNLYDYLADAADPVTAFAYVNRIEAFCRALATAPGRGHKRDDIRPGLRILGFERRVTIAFTAGPERVTILRLFYAGRDWERSFS